MLAHWAASLACLLGNLGDFVSTAFLVLGTGIAVATLVASLWMQYDRHHH